MSRWVHRFCSPKWKNETVERKERRDLFCFFFWWVGGFMFYVNCLLTWFSLYQAEIGNKLTCRILHIEAETSSSMNLKQHRQTQKLENIGGQRNIMIVIYNHRVFFKYMHAYIYICQLRIMKRVIGHPNISYICGVSGPWRLANQAIHRTFGFWDVPWMDDEMGLGWWWWGGPLVLHKRLLPAPEKVWWEFAPWCCERLASSGALKYMDS